MEGARQLLQWSRARETFLGQNTRRRDFNEGLFLARGCDDEEARWLVGLFPAGVSSVENAAVVFLLQPEDDAKALYFAGVLLNNRCSLICRAAELGYARAQSHMTLIDPCDEFRWASKAAAQRDSFGLLALSKCYSQGNGCEINLAKARQFLQEAAEMHCYWAMSDLLTSECDVLERVRRCHQMATFSLGHYCMRTETNHVVKVFDQCGMHADAVFLAGAMLKDVRHRALYEVGSREHPNPCHRAVALCNFWTDAAREMCVAWVLCAKRMGLNKDVRGILSQMLWATRSEALHTVPNGMLKKMVWKPVFTAMSAGAAFVVAYVVQYSLIV